MALLYLRALKAGDRLALNSVEQLKTRSDIVSFSVMAATGVVSTLMAWLLPPQLGNLGWLLLRDAADHHASGGDRLRPEGPARDLGGAESWSGRMSASAQMSTVEMMNARALQATVPVHGDLLLVAAPTDQSLAFAAQIVEAGSASEHRVLSTGLAGRAVAPGPFVAASNNRASLEWEGLELGDLFYRVTRQTAGCAAPDSTCIFLRLHPGDYRVRWSDGLGAPVAKTEKFRVYAGETAVFSSSAVVE